MANANLVLITTANTFTDWLNLTDNEANSINELRNGNYYKDGGNFTVAAGSILIITPSGTTLSVTANALVSGYLTAGNLSITQNLVVTGGANVANLNATGTINTTSNIANAGNVLVTQNTTTGNLSVTTLATLGNSSVTGIENVATSNVSTLITTAWPAKAIFAGQSPANGAALPAIVLGGQLNGNQFFVQMNVANTGAANNGLWEQLVNNVGVSGANSGSLIFRTNADNQTKFNEWLHVNRQGVNIVSVIIGNNSDNPQVNVNGSLNVSGILAAAGIQTPNAVTYANGTAVVQTANINFNNTVSVNVSVTANGVTQANVGLNVNTSSFITGTNTTITFIDGPNANSLTGNSNLNYDKVNVFMGIGTTTPNANLDVNGQVRANNYQEHYNNVGTLSTLASNANWTAINCAYFTGNNVVTSSGQGGATQGWDKLLYSKNTFTTGTLTFQVPGIPNPSNSVAVMVGFSSNPIQNGASYASLDYALYYIGSNTSSYQAYSFGQQVQTGHGSGSNGDISKITFDGTTMKVWIDGVLLFSNTTASNGAPWSSMKNYHYAVALNENSSNTSNCSIVGFNGINIQNIDCRQGDFQDISLTNDSVITLQNTTGTGNTTTLSLFVRQIASNGSNLIIQGPWGLNVTNNIMWSDNAVPVLSGGPGANTGDMLVFKTYNKGVTWLGMQAMGNVGGANVY